MELTVLDNKGKPKGSVQLDESFIPKKGSKSVLHEVVVAHLANQRSGNHSSKTRAEVSGSGKKPWRQKGTGRARSGSVRSPLWRHGGIIFAPKPRDYNQPLTRKKKLLAFAFAFQELVESKRLQVVEPIKISEPKTKNVASVYKKWKAPTDSLLVVDKKEDKFVKASRNISNVKVIDAASLNTYECLRARQIFVTPEALTQLSSRLAKKGSEKK